MVQVGCLAAGIAGIVPRWQCCCFRTWRAAAAKLPLPRPFDGRLLSFLGLAKFSACRVLNGGCLCFFSLSISVYFIQLLRFTCPAFCNGCACYFTTLVLLALSLASLLSSQLACEKAHCASVLWMSSVPQGACLCLDTFYRAGDRFRLPFHFFNTCSIRGEGCQHFRSIYLQPSCFCLLSCYLVYQPSK